MIPPIHLMRKCPVLVSVFITSQIWSILKFIRASWCCIILFTLKFVHAHFVCADVGTTAIAVLGGAVFIIVVRVGAETLLFMMIMMIMIMIEREWEEKHISTRKRKSKQCI